MLMRDMHFIVTKDVTLRGFLRSRNQKSGRTFFCVNVMGYLFKNGEKS